MQGLDAMARFVGKHTGRVVAEIYLGSIEDEILEWVRDKFSPEDVFAKDELSEWATENGFTESA